MKILIVDDHEFVRQGLRTVLEAQEGWRVCGEAENGRMAVQLARKLQPDVVVMDLAMPEFNGLEATRELHKLSPATKVVILTVYETDTMVKEVLQAGASGYLLKSDAADKLVTAIETVRRGEPFFSGRVASVVLRALRAPEERRGKGAATDGLLTVQERRIVQLVAEGKTNKEIAAIFGVSIKTVDAHRTHLMAKLNLHSVVDLVRHAIRNNIIQA